MPSTFLSSISSGRNCVLWVFLSNLVHPEATGSALAVTNINIHSVTSFGIKGQKRCWESHSSQLKTVARLLHMWILGGRGGEWFGEGLPGSRCLDWHLTSASEELQELGPVASLWVSVSVSMHNMKMLNQPHRQSGRSQKSQCLSPQKELIQISSLYSKSWSQGGLYFPGEHPDEGSAQLAVWLLLYF